MLNMYMVLREYASF